MFESKVSLFPTDPPPVSGPSARRRRIRLAGALAVLGLALTALGCGGDIEARMAEVRALQDVGQFTASIDELREILAVAPDLPEASYRLGVALMQTGEPSRAVWALEKASESDEYAIPASLLLASAHFSAQNFEATVRAADRVLELDPERHAALRIRAQGNLGAGRLDIALEDTERLLELFPDDYGVHALYATLLADVGRVDESRVEHDLLKELALEGGDPTIAHRGCLAPAIFARDTDEDMELAAGLYADCAERFPTNGLVISETMRFYDAQGQGEDATALVRRAVEEAPENLSLRSQLANRLRTQGDPDGAEKVLLEAVESFKSAGAWSLLANFYRQQGEPEKAIEAIDKVTELSGGGSDQLRFTQADVLIDLGELEKAEEIAQTLEEATYANLLRGRVALERGNAKEALRLFDQGIRAWPSNAGARYLAGLAARKLGDSERAVSELRESVRVDQSATPAAEVLMRVHFERGEYGESVRFGKIAARRRGASHADIYVIGARALAELREYDEARKTVDALRGIQGQEATAAVELASLRRAQFGPESAVASIEASGLDLTDPANEKVLRAYVDHQIALEQTEVSLKRIDAALAAHPDAAIFHDMRGSVLIRLGRDDDARKAFEKTVELDPENAAGWGGLATLAARGNDLPKAIELFDKAAELATNTALYPYSAAQLTLAGGDIDGAEQRLRDIVRDFPAHAGARNDLAWILAERGVDLDRALELAQEAQRLDPSPEVLDTLGWVRFKRGESAAAVAALEQAVDARSDSPSIRYRLGIALAKAGDSERAREMLQAAIDSGSFPEAADAQRELTQLEQP